jgi:hypothetical protein
VQYASLYFITEKRNGSSLKNDAEPSEDIRFLLPECLHLSGGKMIKQLH